MNVQTLIIKSNHPDYEENMNKQIKIKKKIGGGSYGLVFSLDNEHVIKIFKDSTLNNTILNETNYLLPIKNENRELIFFFKFKNAKKEHNYIISLYAIGLMRDKITYENTKFDENSYFIILPYCTPFYETHKILNSPLIYSSNGIKFTLEVMRRLLELSEFLETKYDYVNIDLHLDNFLFAHKSKDLKDLIMIDFSIIKKNFKSKKYNVNNNKYYIWPNENNLPLEYMPSYCISMNGLELLFGHNRLIEFLNKDFINYSLKVIQSKNKHIYNIFYNGLVLKITTQKFIKLINHFFANHISTL